MDATFFELDLGEEGGKFTWPTAEDAIAWIQMLREEWSWTAQIGINSTNSFWQSIYGPLDGTIANIQQADNQLKAGQSASPNIDAAKIQLHSLLENHSWLISGSPRQRFVEGVRSSGRISEAGVIAAHWLNIDLSGTPMSTLVQALLSVEFYERGIKDRVKNESAALKKLYSDMQSSLNGIREEEKVQATHFDELDRNIAARTLAATKDFARDQHTRTTTWAEYIGKLSAEIETIKQTYKTELALAAPVTYWETKRTRHFWSMIVCGVVLIAGMLLAGSFLHDEIQSVSKAFNLAEVSKDAATKAIANDSTLSVKSLVNFSATWRVGSLLLFATLVLWALRILVRIFFSNMHLEHDAAERVTMAKTYLSLISEGHLPPGDSINVVLTALFRPTGDGFIKDEGIPPATMDFLSKLGGKN